MSKQELLLEGSDLVDWNKLLLCHVCCSKNIHSHIYMLVLYVAMFKVEFFLISNCVEGL